MTLKRLIFPLIAFLGAMLSFQDMKAQTPPAPAQWLVVETPPESRWVLADDPAAGEKIDVAVRDGHVYVTVNRPMAIKVFTILGQPVATRSIQPGSVRLRLPQRGIYILKAGETTRRVNI